MKGLNPMTQADRVLSTPRRTASKNRVKKVAEAVENTEQRNLRHGEAFRELESPMRELGCMAEITIETAMESPRARRMRSCITRSVVFAKWSAICAPNTGWICTRGEIAERRWRDG
jgi:hypothetical protein